MTWNAMLMAMSVVSSNPALAEGRPDAEEVTPQDLSEIRSVIRRQLLAFRAGDQDAAWALCSDAIRQTFAGPESLLRTVFDRYLPLVLAEELRFGEVLITPVGLGVVCELTDEDGDVTHAVYMFTRREDGAWAANGCLLVDGEVEVPALAA